MTKKQESMAGAELVDKLTGARCKVVMVAPHGKTAVRYMIESDHSDYKREVTQGQLDRDYRAVELGEPDYNLQFSERVDAIIKLIDGEFNGAVPYRYGNVTEIRSNFTDIHGREFCDIVYFSRPMLSDAYRMSIQFCGGRSEMLEVTRDEMAQQTIWAAYKPVFEALRDSIMEAQQ